MSERSSLLLLLYGPGILGLLALFGVCLFGRRKRSLIWACAISVLLQLVTFIFMNALAGHGSGGNSAVFDFPRKVLFSGLAATAILTGAKAAHLGLQKHR
jgi:hypothetical protein